MIATLTELREALRADFRRNGGGGPRLTLTIFRVGQYCHANTSLAASLLKPLWRAADVVYLRTLLHCEMPAAFNCGPGLSLPHAGRGVVVHHNATLGANSMLYHRVTLGAQGGRAPRLANDVTIGAGACVLGPIHVGERARIGANAVVVTDVGAGETAVGVPARVRSTEAQERGTEGFVGNA